MKNQKVQKTHLLKLKRLLTTCFVVLKLCSNQLVTGQNIDDDTVDLVQGTLRGSSRILDGRRVYYFLGVPYAEPPLNNRRFRPSSPHNGWQGTYTAREFKPVCPQPTGNIQIRDQMSEDCLYLNVWTPFLPRRGDTINNRRPVIFFIEGMLFLLSNPRDIPVDDLVSEEDVVIVTLSYRVNAFGFFSYEDQLMPGNLGLRDQQLALLWVSENIDSFGGDPNSITVMGHSAGAASAMYHLISERSRLYIQRVALMSGSVLAPWAHQVNPRANARILANNLRCYDYDASSLLQCLQNKPMLDIVAEVNRMVQNGNTSALFSPVNEYDWVSSDQRFIGKDPLTALKRGDFKKVPMIDGVMAEEGVLMGYFLKENLNRLNVREISFFVMNSVIPAVIRQMPSLPNPPTDFVRDVISYGYFGDVSRLRSDGITGGIQDTIANSANLDERDRGRLYQEIVAFFTDVYFVAPIERQNRLVSIANGGASGNVGQNPIYFYSNDFRSEDIFGNTLLNRSGPSHGSDLLYLFGPLMYRRFFGRDFQSFSEERQARNLKQLFSDFVYGNFPGNLQWRPYTLLDRYYYEIDGAIEGRRYRGERAYNFWEVYLPNLVEQVNAVNSTMIQEQLIIYTAFTYIFLIILLILIIVLVCCFAVKRKRDRTTDQPKRKDSKTKFAEPLEDEFETEPPVFTIDSGRGRNKRPFSMGKSSFRSPDAPPAESFSTTKSPINSGYINTGYQRNNPSVPQPTGKSRAFSKDSRDSGMNSGLSDYISRMDPGRLSSRRWRESVTDYRM